MVLPRFRIRTLMIAVAVFGLACAYLIHVVNKWAIDLVDVSAYVILGFFPPFVALPIAKYASAWPPHLRRPANDKEWSRRFHVIAMLLFLVVWYGIVGFVVMLFVFSRHFNVP